MAVAALQRREVNRIVLTRPAVEAGERLGFLPGDLMAKVDPYLRPLFDALYDMLDPEKVNQHLERGVIEVAPLAYMRGRTLNDSFIILDEAQNTTPEQMKMFLTRLGFNSKMVVTGDITQIDLEHGPALGARRDRRHPRRRSRASSSCASAARTSSATSSCSGSSRPTTSTPSQQAPELRPAAPHAAAPRRLERASRSRSNGAATSRPLRARRARRARRGRRRRRPPGDRLRRRGRDPARSTASTAAGTARPTCCRSRSTGPGRAPGPRELGDVVICPEHTEDLDEAVVHGVLHLCGYDHETDDGEMLALQDRVMAGLR